LDELNVWLLKQSADEMRTMLLLVAEAKEGGAREWLKVCLCVCYG
jgi:hypothetical protein